MGRRAGGLFPRVSAGGLETQLAAATPQVSKRAWIF